MAGDQSLISNKMADILNKEQLQEEANKVFDQFPNAKRVFATADGNVFLQENRANLHAGKKGSVYPFDRPIEKKEDNEVNTEKPAKAKLPKADDQIKAIFEAKTLEELEAFKSDERVTVKGALEAKIEELSKPAQ